MQPQDLNGNPKENPGNAVRSETSSDSHSVGSIFLTIRHKTCLQFTKDEVVPDEEVSDPDLQQQADAAVLGIFTRPLRRNMHIVSSAAKEIEELRQALRTAQKEAAKQLQTLED